MAIKQPTCHIVGAGLAGLASAVYAWQAGYNVALYEASDHAGGRCRSYYDKQLDCWLDNGQHLLLSSNKAVWQLLATVGAANAPWVAMPTNWPVYASDHQPDTPLQPLQPWRQRGFLRFIWQFMRTTPATRVVDWQAANPCFYQQYIVPLTVSVLNTQPEQASAWLLKQTLRRSFSRWRDCFKLALLQAWPDLNTALIHPLTQWLGDHDVAVHYGWRLDGLALHGNHLQSLTFQGQPPLALAAEDRIILALPPWQAAKLCPWLPQNWQYDSIVNLHIKTVAALGQPVVGVADGLVDWWWQRPDHISATLSAANAHLPLAADFAAQAWAKLQAVLPHLPTILPPHRLIIEKRATLVHSPQQLTQRPPAHTPYHNLYLAGDWTDTGLPCTLEGAVTSAHNAVKA